MSQRPPQERIEALTESRTQLVHQRTPKSREWRERSLKSLPLGVPSSFQDSPPYPIFFERGKGSRVWDVDGNEYSDYHNGFGVMAVGHAHPKIVKIEGSYHGHHESVLVSIRPSREAMGARATPASVPFGQGTPAAVTDLTLIVPYNDAEALDRLLTAHAGQVAALIMEPVMMNVGIIDPEAGYLQAVRDVCTRHEVVLIWDEVKTAATIAYGGAEEVFGVAPDLKCFAKAVGGGVPFGAFGGRGDLMAEIAKDGVPQLGTFNGNPLSARAGLVALTEILTPGAYDHLNRLDDAQLAGCQRVIDAYDLPMYTTGMGAKGAVMYAPERLRDYRGYAGFDSPGVDADLSYLSWLYEMTQGVFMTPGIDEQWTLSVQHGDDDFARDVSGHGGP